MDRNNTTIVLLSSLFTLIAAMGISRCKITQQIDRDVMPAMDKLKATMKAANESQTTIHPYHSIFNTPDSTAANTAPSPEF